jgi:transcriptional regulator with XRE-family HTH domain
MPNRKVDGARLRKLREERMWTQEQLVEVSGVALRTIQRAEQGESVGVETLKALASVFKVDGDVLVLRDPPAAPAPAPEHKVVVLPRLTTAGQIRGLLPGHAYAFMNDDPQTPDETNALGAFLDNLRDWGDVWSDISVGEQLEAAKGLREQLAGLEALGFWAFGMMRPKVVPCPEGEPMRWQVAHVVVVRSTNPSIVKKDGEEGSAVLPILIPLKGSVLS